MSIVVAALVRTCVYAAALTGFYAALTNFATKDGGANIGAGLLAFVAIAAASFVWAIVDARHREIAQTILIWATVAALFSVGWLVVRAVLEADASMSALELVLHDFFLIPFIAALVLGPAVVGAAIGHALRPSQPV